MHKKIVTLGIKKLPGLLYYVKKIIDDKYYVYSQIPKQVMTKQVIAQVKFNRMPNCMYIIDSDGDIAECSTARKKPKKTVAPKSNGYAATQHPTNQVNSTVHVNDGNCSATPIIPSNQIDYIAIVLDSSASMRSIQYDAKAMFDLIVTNIKNNASKNKIYLSLYTFDSGIQTVLQAVDVTSIANVTRLINYSPNGHATAIFNATTQVINDFEAIRKSYSATDNVSFVINIITDGENNAGNISAANLNQYMQSMQNTDKYTFAFMLPVGFKNKFCSTFQIPSGNVAEWEQNSKGTQAASTISTQSFNQYFATRSAGATSTKTFYSNAANITQQDLSKLTNIAHQIKTYPVKAETELRDFCIQVTGSPFVKGAPFYQLTKPEKIVQSYKTILIRKKKTREIYAGPEARTLLGLPIGVDIRLNPGNHADYDIFIQSFSVNRKLVRGTDLIYWIK